MKELTKIDALMLDGWTPIILLGVVFIVGVYFISRKVSRKAFFTVSLVVSLIGFAMLIFSIFAVGGWEGMGLGIFTLSALLGTWIGTLLSLFIKK